MPKMSNMIICFDCFSDFIQSRKSEKNLATNVAFVIRQILIFCTLHDVGNVLNRVCLSELNFSFCMWLLRTLHKKSSDFVRCWFFIGFSPWLPR
jgi:hypothetical protein